MSNNPSLSSSDAFQILMTTSKRKFNQNEILSDSEIEAKLASLEAQFQTSVALKKDQIEFLIKYSKRIKTREPSGKQNLDKWRHWEEVYIDAVKTGYAQCLLCKEKNIISAYKADKTSSSGSLNQHYEKCHNANALNQESNSQSLQIEKFVENKLKPDFKKNLPMHCR
jgi:hypothetical protein